MISRKNFFISFVSSLFIKVTSGQLCNVYPDFPLSRDYIQTACAFGCCGGPFPTTPMDACCPSSSVIYFPSWLTYPIICLLFAIIGVLLSFCFKKTSRPKIMIGPLQMSGTSYPNSVIATTSSSQTQSQIPMSHFSIRNTGISITDLPKYEELYINPNIGANINQTSVLEYKPNQSQLTTIQSDLR